MQAYSEDYLFDAMEALGEAFDCAANRVNLGLDQFFEMFVATGVADAFGAGAPRYVSGSSGIELVLDVCYRAGLDIGVPLADMASDGEGPDYWCGWVLAYWQWETGRPFRTIGRVTTMEEIRALYWPLHEAAEQKFVEVIEERVARRAAIRGVRLAPLGRYRFTGCEAGAPGRSSNETVGCRCEAREVEGARRGCDEGRSGCSEGRGRRRPAFVMSFSSLEEETIPEVAGIVSEAVMAELGARV